MVLFVLMLACGTANDSAVCTDGPTYDGFTKGFLIGKCQPCHGSNTPNRFGAPENVHFDTRDKAVDQADAIRRTVLEAQSMPPSGGVTEDEQILLEAWLDCIEEL